MSTCQVCNHVERVRAELLIARGASIVSVAQKFEIPYDAMWRHWSKHVDAERKTKLLIGPVRQAHLASIVGEEAESVIDHLKIVRAGLYSLYDAAVSAGDRHGGALLAGRLHENLRIIAKITGELANSPLVLRQQNIFIAPEFVALQAELIRVLGAFPEARDAVIKTFRQLEQSGPPALPPTEEKVIDGEQSEL